MSRLHPDENNIQVRLRELVCKPLGLAPSTAQLDSLAQFLAQLQHWNRTYNLTAVRDPQAMFTQHLADCLAILPAMDRLLAPGANQMPLQVLDVGSGGGLPGAILAIMRPQWLVTCVDTVGKKAAFVQQVSGTLQLKNLVSAHSRVEQLQPAASASGAGFDLITSRAFASLDDFCRLTRHLLKANGRWMALKGRPPEVEIRELKVSQPDIEVFHVEPLQVPALEAQRCLVWMGIQPSPDPPAVSLKASNPA